MAQMNRTHLSTKKGLLFTIVMMMIATTIVVYGYLIFSFHEESNDKYSDYTSFKTLNNIEESITTSVQKIFAYESGIIANVSGTILYYQETLPNSQNTSFYNNITALENFAELHDVRLNVSFHNLTKFMEFTVDPYNITIGHERWGGKNVFMEPQEPVGNYTLDLYTEADIVQCIINNTHAMGDLGDYNVSVGVTTVYNFVEAIEDGLVAWYQFEDDNSAPCQYGEDCTTNENDGAYHGDIPSVEGKIEKGGSFTGDQYVSVQHSTDFEMTSGITLSVWVKKTTDGYLIVKRGEVE